jgi:hypothetical protein
MAAGLVAATAAIVVTTEAGDTPWVRVAMVAALGSDRYARGRAAV